MDDEGAEEPLLGGNASVGVVRVGRTVRRPARSSSRSVDALLRHFERVGVDGVPRALGYDDRGRQVLSYVEGYVDADPSDLDVTRVFEVGALIRELHDTVEGFAAPEDAEWNVLIAPDREELICHHDLAPWNLVRTSTQLFFIDWDGAGPGSRLWDLAYAAHGFVPLSPRAGLSDEQAGVRLSALIDGYGLEVSTRSDVIQLMGTRTRAMYDFLRLSYQEGAEPWSRLWLEGHGVMWLDDALYIEERRRVWEDALL